MTVYQSDEGGPVLTVYQSDEGDPVLTVYQSDEGDPVLTVYQSDERGPGGLVSSVFDFGPTVRDRQVESASHLKPDHLDLHPVVMTG